MSFGLPSVKVKPELGCIVNVPGGTYGVAQPFVAGLAATKPKLAVSHPLEYSERNYHANAERMSMTMLKNVQGLHAPLKLEMEKKFCSKIGHLPFLPSSNFQMDILTGRHLDIGFEDILGTPDMCEYSGQPHAVVERSLGIL